MEGTGDFYGDGNTDILLQNDNGPSRLGYRERHVDRECRAIADPGPSWRVEGTGDFYSDGNTDVLLQNSDGAVAIWDVANGTQLARPA